MAKPEKPIIIDGIDITRVYTIGEIQDMYYRGYLRKVAVHGYVVQARADGTVRFVPWYESHMARAENDQLRETDWSAEAEQMRLDVEREHPMSRRTPQQRVASMLIRLMGEVKRTGRITGLSDEQVQSIVGKTWKEGMPLSEEDVRAVAAHFLGIAQVDNREADSHRVTRAHQFA